MRKTKGRHSVLWLWNGMFEGGVKWQMKQAMEKKEKKFIKRHIFSHPRREVEWPETVNHHFFLPSHWTWVLDMQRKMGPIIPPFKNSFMLIKIRFQALNDPKVLPISSMYITKPLFFSHYCVNWKTYMSSQLEASFISL